MGHLKLLVLSCSTLAVISPTVLGDTSPQADQAFNAAARFQNDKQFDLAADDWERFTSQFPNDPRTSKAKYYAGVCRQQLGEYARAIEHFQRVLKDHAADPVAEDALLNLGWCQFSLASDGRRELYQTASRTFARLQESHPDGKYADRALFFQGEAQYALGNLAEAAAHYQRLVDRYPRSPRFGDALYALGVAWEEQEKFSEAKRAYERFLRTPDSGDLAAEVQMRIAETELRTGNLAAAERQFAEIARRPGFSDADHALWRQAFAVAQQERYEEAAKLYAALASRFPTSEYREESVLASARCYYRAGQFDQAKRGLLESLNSGGRPSEAAHWMAQIYLKQDDVAAARRLIDKALGATGRDDPFRVHLEMDQADVVRESDPSRAIELYRAIGRSYPEHPLAAQALYDAAFGLMEGGRYEDARKAAQDFLQRYRAHELEPDVRHVAAESALQLRDYRAADADYRQLVDAYPRHTNRTRWQLRMAMSAHLQDRHRDALASLAGLSGDLQEASLRAECQFMQGSCHFALNEFDKAARELESSHRTSAKWEGADQTLLLLARSRHAAGRPDEAVATIKQLVQQHPRSELLDQAYYRLGEIQAAAGRFEPAQAAFRQLLERWSDSSFAPHARYALGWARLKAGNAQAAIAAFRDLLGDNSARDLHRDSRLALAMAYRRAEMYRESRRELATFLESGPTGEPRANALFELGLAAAAEEDYQTAQRSFLSVIQEFPAYKQMPDVLLELGWTYRELEDDRRAKAAFQRLLDRFADHPLANDARYYLGEQHYQAGRFDQAASAFLAVQGANATAEIVERATHKLGWTRYRQKRYQDSAAAFKRQLATRPDGPLADDATFMLAECLFQEGDYRAAWPAFEAASRQLPNAAAMQVLVLLHGGQAAAQLGKWSDSFALLDQIPSKFPDSELLPEALFERGRAYKKLGQRDQAIADFQRAASESQDEVGARARFMIGEDQFEHRDFSQAVTSFRRVMFGYGGQDAEAAVRRWQALAAFEAGRCAEVQIQQAKTDEQRAAHRKAAASFYEYLLERHGDHELAGQARSRLSQLRRRSE